jgi:hypothetical protein
MMRELTGKTGTAWRDGWCCWGLGRQRAQCDEADERVRVCASERGGEGEGGAGKGDGGLEDGEDEASAVGVLGDSLKSRVGGRHMRGKRRQR